MATASREEYLVFMFTDLFRGFVTRVETPSEMVYSDGTAAATVRAESRAINGTPGT